MCGILLSIANNDDDTNTEVHNLHSRLKPLLERRGPDSQKSASDHLKLGGKCISLSWHSTVLSLRGYDVVAQPLVDPGTGSQLCWNGEAWSIAGNAVSGNDAIAVFDMLIRATTTAKESTAAVETSVIEALMSISGPFAFVYHDAVNARIYYGRDSVGRRSLLSRNDANVLTISSVCDGSSNWSEIPADGIYVIHLSLMPDMQTSTAHYAYKDYGKYSAFNREAPPSTIPRLDVHCSAVCRLEYLLRKAIEVRTMSIPYRRGRDCNETTTDGRANGNAIPEANVVIQPRVAVLFSGGLDCTVLARLLHDAMPMNEDIDLLNVAFHNPRSHGPETADNGAVYELCPDRITARTSHAELARQCPERRWRLVQINVSYEEMLKHREQVTSLMHPHDTEMDLSIALALYFAARGVGASTESDGDVSINYVTPARVLFSGLGADELFGGYQRHATAYSRSGLNGLLDELELDITRLGQRNLGRDDRVISHWRKEARYPFLDEELIHWAVTAPVWDKCGFGQMALPADVQLDPEKKVLRLLAHKLGMVQVAREKKRAIQFGARTAKMEIGGGKLKGTKKIS